MTPGRTCGRDLAPATPTIAALIEALDPEVRAAIADVDRTLIALRCSNRPGSG